MDWEKLKKKVIMYVSLAEAYSFSVGGGVKGAASPQTFPSDFLNGKKLRKRKKKTRKFIPFTS